MPAASHHGTQLAVVTFPSEAGWPQQAWGDIPRQKEVTLGGASPGCGVGPGALPRTQTKITQIKLVWFFFPLLSLASSLPGANLLRV